MGKKKITFLSFALCVYRAAVLQTQKSHTILSVPLPPPTFIHNAAASFRGRINSFKRTFSTLLFKFWPVLCPPPPRAPAGPCPLHVPVLAAPPRPSPRRAAAPRLHAGPRGAAACEAPAGAAAGGSQPKGRARSCPWAARCGSEATKGFASRSLKGSPRAGRGSTRPGPGGQRRSSPEVGRAGCLWKGCLGDHTAVHCPCAAMPKIPWENKDPSAFSVRLASFISGCWQCFTQLRAAGPV